MNNTAIHADVGRITFSQKTSMLSTLNSPFSCRRCISGIISLMTVSVASDDVLPLRKNRHAGSIQSILSSARGMTDMMAN